MICSNCGYDENKQNAIPFVGIFNPGTVFITTENEQCNIYGCPECHTVIFTTNRDYINKRKIEYKEKTKNN